MTIDITYRPVLFFDGLCNLCNSTVQYIIKHDKQKRFMFASLQSEQGARAIATIHNDETMPAGSVILFYKGRYYTRSAAVLYTVRLLGGFLSVLYAGIIIPRFIRDGIYNFIARNRYKWFGKKNECMIPTPELKERFLSN